MLFSSSPSNKSGNIRTVEDVKVAVLGVVLTIEAVEVGLMISATIVLKLVIRFDPVLPAKMMKNKEYSEIVGHHLTDLKKLQL